MTSWMRSRLRVTLRSSDWRKLSTLLSSPVVASELRRELEEAERADLRREEPPDLAVLRDRLALPERALLRDRAVLFDFELRLAVVLRALEDLALDDFERVLFALLRELALLLDDPLRLVLLEPLLAPDFFVAISPPRSAALACGDYFIPGSQIAQKRASGRRVARRVRPR